MNPTEFANLLKELGACSEAVVWAKEKSLAEVWAICERGDWMLWLCGKMCGKKGWPTRQEIVLVACDCADIVLPIFEKEYPNEKRPRTAIETARKWANGEATLKEVSIAAAAAAAANAAANAANAAQAAANAAAYVANAVESLKTLDFHAICERVYCSDCI